MAFPAMKTLPCDVLGPAEAGIKAQCPQLAAEKVELRRRKFRIRLCI